MFAPHYQRRKNQKKFLKLFVDNKKNDYFCILIFRRGLHKVALLQGCRISPPGRN